ncbi:MAG: hypothetical protein FIB08_08735 [Candidatus Methanoperedens sp.]|nr:hypothetical protein [Candidatus Methanoperedens sp.]
MTNWICLLTITLIVLAGAAAAEEDMSSATVAQFAVSRMGDTNQETGISGFEIASASQIGYSWDGSVTQNIYYDNVGGGNIIQWGESGDMAREERSLFLDKVGNDGFTWEWNKGDVNQSITVTNSEKIYMKQIMGGLKRILFPDPKAPAENSGNWWFCGSPVDGKGGLPLCAEKMGKKVFNGKAKERDFYLLQILAEDYDVYPPENLTPHVTMTKWNVTKDGDNLVVKFRAQNFGRKTYNATLMLDMTPKVNVTNLDGIIEKMQGEGTNGKLIELKAEDDMINVDVPEKLSKELGRYTVQSMKRIETEVVIPLNGTKIQNLGLRMKSE